MRLGWIRNATVSLEAVVDIFSNEGSGEVDFQKPIREGLPYWDVWQDKWGYGLSCFGMSDFGYDGAGAVGFGRGYFGGGEFGFDAEEIKWISDELKAGEYRFGIKIRSNDGSFQESVGESGTITVLPAAKGGEKLTVSSYDRASNSLTLSI